MSLTLHISNKNYSSWSLRAWILLKVLDIPFTEQQHFYGADNRTEFGKFSPTALVPCLVEGPTVVWESISIAEYLYESHPAVWPAERVARAFARSAAAEMHAGFGALRSICNMNCGVRVELPAITPELERDLGRLRDLFEQGLAAYGGPFLAGDRFTAVDAFYAPIAFRAQTYGLKLGTVADAYLQRLLDLPAMQEWYRTGLLETQRSAMHEDSLVAPIVQDFRVRVL